MPPQYHAFNTHSSSSAAPYAAMSWSPSTSQHHLGGGNQGGTPLSHQGDEYEDGEEDDDEEDDEEEEEEGDGEAPSTSASTAAANKKRKREQMANVKTEEGGTASGNGAKKPKPTRGSKACKNCRRLKMRCVGAENGPPCNRCSHTGHECIFEESNRGKKGGKNQRAEMAQSLKKMEQTLATVLRTIRDPSSLPAQAGGMLTRSPSPTTLFPSLRNLTEAERERITSGWRSRDPPAATEADAEDSNESGSGPAPPILAPVGSKPSTPMPWMRSISGYASPGGKHMDPSAFSGVPGPSAAMAAPSISTPPSSSSGTRFLEPVPHYHANDPTLSSKGPSRDRWRSARHTSPRLHSLPDNTLNPLGLLAEASLHNSHRLSRRSKASSSSGDSNRGKERSVSLSGISPHTPAVRIDGESPAGSANGVSPGNAVDSTSPAATGDGVTSGSGGSKTISNTADGGADAGQELDPYKTRRDEDERVSLGVASETYFKPGPMTILPLRRIIIERERPPEILTEGIVSSHEVLELFQIFFHHCAQHMLLLDPDWHTPSMIFSRSPFLFTVVCAVASRFYTKRPELYATCLSLAKKVALDCISRGYKSVEIVQGFLLLCLWNQPAERWEEDKTWLFSGVAIRVATDLNLHRKSVASLPNAAVDANDPAVLEREREILNRERTWYLCYAVDRSLSVQMGKPYSIREDWIIRNCRLWSSQRLSKPWDVGISALVDLQRMQSRQLDFLYSSTSSVSGLNTDIDYTSVLTVFNEQLDEWNDLWQSRGIIGKAAAAQQARARAEARAQTAEDGGEQSANTESEDHEARTMQFIVKQAPLRFWYVVLILNSFGLQHAIDNPGKAGIDKAVYFSRCLTAAKSIVNTACDALRSVLRYAPDTQIVVIAYAAVHLLKLARPTFAAYVDEDEILELVSNTADVLEECAVSNMHTPALYATFLRALLQSRMERTTNGTNTPYRSRAGSPDGNALGAAGLDTKVAQGGPTLGAGGIPGDGAHSGPGATSASLDASSAAAFAMPGADDSDGDQQPSATYSTTAGNGAGGPGGSSGNGHPSTLNAAPGSSAATAALNGLDPSAFTQAALGLPVDQMLNDSFWSSLLPPGFGGPLDGLPNVPNLGLASSRHGSFSNPQTFFGGGNPEVGNSSAAATAALGLTPAQTRANTPSMLNNFASNLGFDFSSGTQQ